MLKKYLQIFLQGVHFMFHQESLLLFVQEVLQEFLLEILQGIFQKNPAMISFRFTFRSKNTFWSASRMPAGIPSEILLETTQGISSKISPVIPSDIFPRIRTAILLWDYYGNDCKDSSKNSSNRISCWDSSSNSHAILAGNPAGISGELSIKSNNWIYSCWKCHRNPSCNYWKNF